MLGSKRLDAIGNEQVQGVKRHLADRAPKTVNNVLTVLNMLLKKAVEWEVIERMPCAIRLLPIPKPSAGFYDFDEYERLVAPANGRQYAYHPRSRTWKMESFYRRWCHNRQVLGARANRHRADSHRV
jgi:hypothetical protein